MKIEIATSSGEPKEIDAQGVGEWAIHRDWFAAEDEKWNVTHVPTGLRIPRHMTRAQAGDVASRLSRDLPTLGLPSRIWSTGESPSVGDLGPSYAGRVATLRAIVAEVLDR